MVKGKFINFKKYDFEDCGKHIFGINMNCLVDDDVVKVSISQDDYDLFVDNGIEFGDEVSLDVKVKGKFAKYILAV